MGLPHVVVLGSINVDLVTNVKTLPSPGSTVFATSFVTENGGKGANQAVAAARLGAKVTMIGRVGSDDFGKDLLGNLESELIDTDMITKDENTGTGVALITVESESENTIVVSSGANMNCGQTELDALKACISTANCLVLQNEIPYKVNLEAALIARSNDIPVVWDPAPFVANSEDLMAEVDFLTPNQNEAELLTKCKIEDEKTVHEALLKIKHYTNAECLITMGSEGVFFLSGLELDHMPGLVLNSIDSVAAGDAFTGGFAVAISEGKSLRCSAGFGSVSGALATTKNGAQIAMPFRTEVDQLIDKTG